MKVRGLGVTDRGSVRRSNEDAIVCREDIGLFAVCDGMGGRAAGEVASRLAAETVERFFLERRAEMAAVDAASEAGQARILEWVRDAIVAASTAIHEVARSGQGRGGMGTTTTLAVVKDDRMFMGHVGDSRLYLCRDGELFQLSEDHSHLAVLLKIGLVSPAEAPGHPAQAQLTRAVGLQPSVEVDTMAVDLVLGDLFLLCSDGLSRYMDDDAPVREILRATTDASIAPAPARLIQLAVDAGGEDNISAVVMRVGPDAGRERRDAERAAQVSLCFDALKRLALFRNLSMKELMQVVDVLQLEVRDAGDTVIREGEAGTSLYVIVDGDLEVTRGGKRLAELGAGSHFGEMSLLNARPRSASVVTRSPSRLLVLERERFARLLRGNAELGAKLLLAIARVLSQRLDETSDLLGDE